MDFVAISVLVRWLLGWALCLRLYRLPVGKPKGNPRVSVLIPARDEEGTLPNLLPALQTQTFTPLEVIVIDDHSSDRTASIAAELGAKVMQPPPLAEGWCGKTWALHHGVKASKGEILVFLDADTEPGPEFLERLVAAQQQLGGLVSVQPFHRTEQAYEQLSVLFSLVGLMAVPMGPGCGVAFGPAMATSRADYAKVGGHEAVAGKVVEDWFMGHLYVEAGLPVSAYIGDGLIEYRMYPGGFNDMVMGFAKNFATAAGEVRAIWMLAVLLWISGLFWAAWCLPASLLGWPLMGQPSVLPNLLLYLAFAVQLITLTWRVGNFAWICLVFPIPVLFFLGVFVLAVFKLKLGTIEWKGRQFQTY